MYAFDKGPMRRARLRERLPVGQALWYVTAAAGVGLVSVLIGLARTRVAPSHLQMSYLLLVLVLAIAGGSGPAILASVLAFLAFDWFFVKPVGNLAVGDPEEWFRLGLFLVVGVCTGTLAARLRQSAAEAQQRTSETATLYELSTAILADTSLEHSLNGVVERLVAALQLVAAGVFLLGQDEKLALSCLSTTTSDVKQLVIQDEHPHYILTAFCRRATAAPGQPRAEPRQPVAVGPGTELRGIYAPLALNGRPLGVLAAYTAQGDLPLSNDAQRLLDAFGAQTALAVGRVRLLQEEERARAAEESDRLKTVFLASVSHDLRTPLTAIKTEVAFLRSEPERDAGIEAMACIDEELDRLNRLVGNLLEISRIEGGSAPPHRLPEDMAELVGATADQMRPLLNGRQLHLSASQDLPLLFLDGPQISRVIMNLLENAIKFSPPETAIHVNLSASDGTMLVRVHNIGTPVPPGEQQRIFEKFYRVRRDSADAAGAGLGLAICKGIVEAHNGQIWTTSENGGVAFYVALPVPAEKGTAGASLDVMRS